MALAQDFQNFLDSLPPDWTALELDLRIADEDRYIEAATLLVQINAMPYSKHDWHWRLRAAHEFGHAAAAETVKGTLALLDDQAIAGVSNAIASMTEIGDDSMSDASAKRRPSRAIRRDPRRGAR